MASGGKKRSPYDKIIKHAVELFRQELAPLQDNQQKIIAQNEKNTEFLRQIWEKLEQREVDPANRTNPPG